jgi:Uma2 family endonuclease
MTVISYRWTVERYHRAIEAGIFDDQSIELLRGELIVMPPERKPHAYYNTEAADYLRSLLGLRSVVLGWGFFLFLNPPQKYQEPRSAIA